MRKAKTIRGESELGKEEWKEDQERGGGRERKGKREREERVGEWGAGLEGHFLAPADVLSGWMVTTSISITSSQWSYHIITRLFFVYIFPKY